MVTVCLAKLLKGIYSARQRVWENHSGGTKFTDKATGCLEKKTLNKWLKNKRVLNLAPSPQKEKQLQLMETVVALTKKGKVVHIK